MSVNYKTADNLPTIDSLTDDTYGIVEESGQLKRIKGSELGSSIKTVGVAVTMSDNGFESATSTMSYEEVHSIIRGDGFLQIIFSVIYDDGVIELAPMWYIYDDTTSYSVPCVILHAYVGGTNTTLYWTADGISIDEPSGGGPE